MTKTQKAPKASTSTRTQTKTVDNDVELALRLRGAIDNVQTAIMMVDRDFVVTYVNATTREMLTKNADHFRKVWPNFDPEKIMGMCIDTFHKNPAHQRNLLSDPKRLPHRAEITVGPLRFSLVVGASYDRAGNYVGNVLEWADVTELRELNANFRGQIDAIRKSQAVIEFTVDGKITDANENFLNTMGYSMDEIRGQHHSLFCDAAFRQSPDYKLFWEALGRGEYKSDQYKRVAKGGREIWIQASYNPIIGPDGKPFKVVKYASEVTAQVKAQEQLQLTVSQTQEAVNAAQANDLTKRIPLDGKSGELLSLCQGVNGVLDSMTGIIGKIIDSSTTISEAAREIAMGNTDLSQRTEEQASSLEETAASLEELTSTVRQNAENAQQANKLATTASEVAVKGGNVVSEVVRTMDDITQASRKISEIIGVIDEIAFQTNILALNAAVEAARAGDQGRGFAVVAAEVRNLAQRSANAAKEIKALISDSVQKVESGSKLVDSAGKTMEDIVMSVKKVTDIMMEISAASKEQSGGIDQVNTAVSQMDKMTQQNAALVEEAAAAAKSMEEQTQDLSESVAIFKLADGVVQQRFSKTGNPVVDKAVRGQKTETPVRRPTPPRAEATSVQGPAKRRAAGGSKADAEWEEF